MASLKCRECDQELEAEDQNALEDSLRVHYLGKNDGAHEYPGKQEFRDLYDFSEEDTSEQPQGSGEDSTIETDEQSPETEKTGQSGESDDLLDVGQMEEKDLDELIDETDQETDSSEESTQSKGLDTAINQAWGRIFTIDLDPEEEETSNIRKNLQGLAEDVGLGQNAAHYYEEELKGQTDDPRSQMLGSLVLAAVLSASMRPDLVQKFKERAEEST